MQKKVTPIITAALAFGLVIQACSFFPETSDAPVSETTPSLMPTPVSVENAALPEATSPKSTSIPTPTPSKGEIDQLWGDQTATEVAGPEYLDLENIDALPQLEDKLFYRQSLYYTFDATDNDGSQITGTVHGRGAFNPQSSATYLEISTEGEALLESGTVFTVTHIEDIVYYNTEDTGCITLFQGGIENPFEALLDASGLLQGTAQRVKPDKTIAGIETFQFIINPINLKPGDPSAGYIKEIHDGRIYIAKDSGYLVRMWLRGIGDSKLLNNGKAIEGEVYYEVNFYDFDVPLAIIPPHHCGDLDDIGASQPLMDDAILISASPGITNYITYYSLMDVVGYYKTEMSKQGWSLLRELVNAPAAILTFENDTHFVQITISEKEANLVVSIVEMEK